jgi:hypothetical protein
MVMVKILIFTVLNHFNNTLFYDCWRFGGLLSKRRCLDLLFKKWWIVQWDLLGLSLFPLKLGATDSWGREEGVVGPTHLTVARHDFSPVAGKLKVTERTVLQECYVPTLRVTGSQRATLYPSRGKIWTKPKIVEYSVGMVLISLHAHTHVSHGMLAAWSIYKVMCIEFLLFVKCFQKNGVGDIGAEG